MVRRKNNARAGVAPRTATRRANPPNPRARGVFAPTDQVHTTRSLWKLQTDTLTLTAPSAQEEVTAPITETKFGNAALSSTLSEYFDVATSQAEYLRTVDQFRLDSIDIYCDASRIPFNNQFRRVCIYFKPDFDDNNVITWRSLQERDGVMMRVICPTDNPVVKLCTIRPSADFRSTSQGSDPSNMIATNRAWFDVVASLQNFVGLKIHAEINSPLSETTTPQLLFPMKAHFSFRGQV